MNYCNHCGSSVELVIPEGDNRERYVCGNCKTIFYDNPKMVVGAIAESSGKILLCQRAIEPSLGKWTLPAGYLENGETIVECAMRETQEEAGAKITALRPFALINLPFINQVYFIFRARFVGGSYHAGSESLAVKLVLPEEIPWQELAFDSIRQTLKVYCENYKITEFPFHILDIPSSK